MHLLGRTLLSLVIILSAYYLFFLRPKFAVPKSLSQTQKILSSHLSILTRNRLAFVELTKINPDSPSASLSKSTILDTLNSTQQQGLALAGKQTYIPRLDSDLSAKYTGMLQETREIYSTQRELLNRVRQAITYSEGLDILTSPESIKLLTRQTNLIFEYQYWLGKINQQLTATPSPVR